ncbi:MAG: hypothetical protein R2705_00990 [Ilumatobacteraceae bacterium]
MTASVEDDDLEVGYDADGDGDIDDDDMQLRLEDQLGVDGEPTGAVAEEGGMYWGVADDEDTNFLQLFDGATDSPDGAVSLDAGFDESFEDSFDGGNVAAEGPPLDEPGFVESTSFETSFDEPVTAAEPVPAVQMAPEPEPDQFSAKVDSIDALADSADDLWDGVG